MLFGSRRILIVTLFFATGIAFGAEVKLGPEIPLVTQIPTDVAAYEQRDPAIASNGRGFLAIWNDRREGAVYADRLYTSRLDGDGRVVEPFGRRFAEAPTYGFFPLIASNGVDYLVVRPIVSPSSFALRYQLQRLDENGSPVGEGRELESGLRPEFLSSNGSTYLLVASKGSALVALAFDRDGITLAKQPLDLFFATTLFSIHASQGRYTVVGYQCCSTNTPAVRTIEEHSGSLTVSGTTLPPFTTNPYNAYPTSAASSDRIMIVWTEEKVRFMIVDRTGSVLTPPTAVDIPFGLWSWPRVMWDGSDFLLTAFSSGSLYAVRIRPDGSLVQSQPYLLSRTAARQPVLASNGTTRVLLWKDLARSTPGDIVALPLHSFDELVPGVPPPVTVVSSSGRAQVNVQIARSGSQQLAVWKDEESHRILGAMNGNLFVIDSQNARVVGNPSVTAGDHSFLVAWYDRDSSNSNSNSGDDRLLVRRYTLEGAPLDEQPAVVRSGLRKWWIDDMPGVAADGSSFVITDDSTETFIRLLRLEAGAAVASEVWKYPCANSFNDYLCWGSTRPIRMASEWVVPFMRYYAFVSPHVAITWNLALLHMPLSGNGGKPEFTVFTGGESLSDLPVVEAGERLAVAQPSFDAIRYQQKMRYSPVLEEFAKLPAATANAVALDLAWNGSEYVMVWTTRNGGPVRAMRFDAGWYPLDAAPFDVAAAGSTAAQPSIAVTDRGVVIAYSRSATESGGAPRAFTRTLDALPPIVVRRRSAGH